MEGSVEEMYKKCAELWSWLAVNPDKKKKEWEGWKTIYHVVEGDCFACQYCKDNDLDCCECPLKGLWGELDIQGKQMDDTNEWCSEGILSPYRGYIQSQLVGDKQKTQEFALQIACYCERKLKEMR